MAIPNLGFKNWPRIDTDSSKKYALVENKGGYAHFNGVFTGTWETLDGWPTVTHGTVTMSLSQSGDQVSGTISHSYGNTGYSAPISGYITTDGWWGATAELTSTAKEYANKQCSRGPCGFAYSLGVSSETSILGGTSQGINRGADPVDGRSWYLRKVTP